MKLLEVRNLHITFDTPQGPLRAVRGVSFELQEGECLGLVGESGCGKSVTALSLMGLLPPIAHLEGDVFWKEENITKWNKTQWQNFRGAEAAMIFQEPGRSFDPLTTVESNFRETFLAHKPNMSKSEIHKATLELLEQVKIPEPLRRLKNYPHQFSGGMLQRLMIALALAHRPRLLLADEPTTALDVTIQNQIIQLLKELQQQYRLTIIFITHNLALLKNFAHRILVLYNGLVLEEGSTEDLLHHPRHPYSQLLIDSLIKRGDRHENRPLPATQGQPPDPLLTLPGCPFATRCPLKEEACTESLPELENQLRCLVVNRGNHARG